MLSWRIWRSAGWVGGCGAGGGGDGGGKGGCGEGVLLWGIQHFPIQELYLALFLSDVVLKSVHLMWSHPVHLEHWTLLLASFLVHRAQVVHILQMLLWTSGLVHVGQVQGPGFCSTSPALSKRSQIKQAEIAWNVVDLIKKMGKLNRCCCCWWWWWCC